MRIFMVFLGVGALKSLRVKTQKRIVVNTWPFTEVCFLHSDWSSISTTTLIDWSTCDIIIRQMLLLGMFWKMVARHLMLLLQGQAVVKARESRTVHELHFEEDWKVGRLSGDQGCNMEGSRIPISCFAVWRFSGLGKSSRWRWRSYTWCYDYGLV